MRDPNYFEPDRQGFPDNLGAPTPDKFKRRGRWWQEVSPDERPEPDLPPIQQIVEIGKVPKAMIEEKVTELVQDAVPKAVDKMVKAEAEEAGTKFFAAVEKAVHRTVERKISDDQKRDLKKRVFHRDTELGLELLETYEPVSVTIRRLRLDGRLPEAEELWRHKVNEFKVMGVNRHCRERRAWAFVQKMYPPDPNVKVPPARVYDSDLDRAFADILWVFDHLGGSDKLARNVSAPSPGAWSMLCWARNHKSEFFKDVYKTALNHIAGREKLKLQTKLARTPRSEPQPIDEEPEEQDGCNNDMESILLSFRTKPTEDRAAQ